MRKKKKNKKTIEKKSPIKQSSRTLHPEGRGFVFVALSLVILISLFSFAKSPGSTNALGLLGHTVGKTFHALFGFSSYALCFFLFWLGWRLLFSKSVNNLMFKGLYVALFVISLSMLLSLIEDRYPYFAASLSKSFYPAPWESQLRFHLGGAPFFYIYHDLPSYNLYRIFNSIGVGIIFTGTLLASMMFLVKFRPRCALEKVKLIYSSLPPLSSIFTPKKREVYEGAKPSIDTSRMVKLRNAGYASEASESSKGQKNEEMLTINPEQNPKMRPSVSRKSGQDLMPSFPFDLPTSLLSEEPPKRAIQEPIKTTDPIIAIEQQLKKDKQSRRQKALIAQSVHNGDFTKFELPDSSLLTASKKVDQTSLKANLRRQAEVLEETLQSFGIEAKVGQINCGPTINSFEVHPAIGVKVQKIKALENDIALNMEAKSIRIIAPIPGKAAVGIEIPNPDPQEVGFKDLLMAYKRSGRKFHIPILLGKSVSGEYVMSDLAKMPHCIIAGATGSGKSVCINTIIMSILFNAKPDEIKMIMVDPKKVELTPYHHLPHMLAPVITEPQGACAALMWLVKEMEKRYDLLKLLGVRNIGSFNSRKIDKQLEESLGSEIPEKLPYIVGIIDELADLMMVASNDIETPIARIAQMARAVGIHLILATQRPSREVITGLIKANFPTRIAFKVASRVNSQIILDETGAETLLGNGDMLFLAPGSSHLTRAQGAYICDEDINNVVKYISSQAPPNYVIESFDACEISDDFLKDGGDEEPKDSLYHNALDIVINTGNASTTFLQRKLKIGYARAASLIDELHSQGIIGPAEGSKPRKVLVVPEMASTVDNMMNETLEPDEDLL